MTEHDEMRLQLERLSERVVRLADIDATDCPYFAIVLVHGKGRHLDAAE